MFVRSMRNPKLIVSASVTGTPKPTAPPYVDDVYDVTSSEAVSMLRW